MRKLLAIGALALGGALIGCNPVDAAFDCHSVCARYRSCFDKTYDVSGCEANCRSRSATDMDFRDRANACDACIDERTCATATFSCGSLCSSIVP